ncbi:hypothetical protein CRI93_05425 [Longimonas halophila]|uniref:KAP NTPase domain-containing protein n=1 Tax=Longimonas halophila TaxID=1469170 RepID=A0A2H3NYK5_9BACT|nr:P-loop NTPase fold protein [Longimonas halophila]PEN07887.1 hypothetical protein CRI93_05425 [Longimonas halophila]
MLPGQIAEPVIPEDVPFRNDKLDREPTADFLTDLLCSAEGPYVMSLNAPWGTGKTTFVKMWKQKLINDGYSALYFNAWENDFADDPLIAFIDAIDVLVDEQSGGSKTEALKDAGGKILKQVAPLGLHLLTAGVLSGNEFDDGFGELLADQKDNIANALIQGGGDLVKAHQQKKGAIEAFRHELQTFVEELQDNAGEDEHAPLFFFVDELDRCRPDFAVELLERIKHLFNVPGIIFILVTNPDQLRHSVKAMYGQGMNAKGYLRRFVDLDYTLPDPEPGAFAGFLFEKYGLGEFSIATHWGRRSESAGGDEANLLLQVAGWSCHVFNLKLREQKQYFARLALIRSVLENRQSIPLPAWALLAFLVALRKKREDLYMDIHSSKSKHEEVDQVIANFESWVNGSGWASSDVLPAAIDIVYCNGFNEYNSYLDTVERWRRETRSNSQQEVNFYRLGGKDKSLNELKSRKAYLEHVDVLKRLVDKIDQKLISLIELAAPVQQ